MAPQRSKFLALLGAALALMVCLSGVEAAAPRALLQQQPPISRDVVFALIDAVVSNDISVLDAAYRGLKADSDSFCFESPDEEPHLRGAIGLEETNWQVTNYDITVGCDVTGTPYACMAASGGPYPCRHGPRDHAALAIIRPYIGAGRYSTGILRCLVSNQREIAAVLEQAFKKGVGAALNKDVGLLHGLLSPDGIHDPAATIIPDPVYKLNICRYDA